MKIRILFLFISFHMISFSQAKREIPLIDIKDSTLVKNIDYLAEREKMDSEPNNPFKNGYGYVSLSMEQFNHGDTLAKFYLSPELYSIKPDSPEKLYPDYYSFVNKRLVIIYIRPSDLIFDRAFSTKAKKKIRKLIDNHLEKPYKRTFFDLTGKKEFTDKHFRLDYIKSNAGLSLYIFRNGTYLTKHD